MAGSICSTTAEPCADNSCAARLTVRRCPAPNVHQRRFACYFPANSTNAIQKPQESISELAGPDAVDCGQHGTSALEDALRQSVRCAVTSGANRQAFQTLRQRQGIDSLVYEGLLGQPDGTIFKFHYDSAPCGGPGCFASLAIERCPVPSLGDFISGFTCAAAGPREKPEH